MGCVAGRRNSLAQTGIRRRTKKEKANYNDLVKLSEK